MTDLDICREHLLFLIQVGESDGCEGLRRENVGEDIQNTGRAQFPTDILDANLQKVWQKAAGECRVYRVVVARLRKLTRGLRLDRNDALGLLLALLPLLLAAVLRNAVLRHAMAFSLHAPLKGLVERPSHVVPQYLGELEAVCACLQSLAWVTHNSVFLEAASGRNSIRQQPSLGYQECVASSKLGGFTTNGQVNSVVPSWEHGGGIVQPNGRYGALRR